MFSRNNLTEEGRVELRNLVDFLFDKDREKNVANAMGKKCLTDQELYVFGRYIALLTKLTGGQ